MPNSCKCYPQRIALALAFLASAMSHADAQVSEQAGRLPRHYAGGPTGVEISARDLMTRLYGFADDSMMGRAPGSPFGDKPSAYIEREVRRLGLIPAGDDGSYFQRPLVRAVLDTVRTTLSMHGTTYRLFRDYLPRDQGRGGRTFNGASVILGGSLGDSVHLVSSAAATGKIVLLTLARDSAGHANWSIIDRAAITARYASAAAIAVGGLEQAPPSLIQRTRDAAIESKTSTDSRPRPAFAYVTSALARAMLGSDPDSSPPGTIGARMQGGTVLRHETVSGRNVLAMLPGSDPARKGQAVVISAHSDHHGYLFAHLPPADHDSVRAFDWVMRPRGGNSARRPETPAEADRVRALVDSLHLANGGVRMDSIWNGADDDGSGSVAVLEIAEALAGAHKRPRRSILFVWHTGEELGLLGSQYAIHHLPLKRDSVVAALNLDMIGRGNSSDVTGITADGQLVHGGSKVVYVVGARRRSTMLGDLIEQVNGAQREPLRVDYTFDSVGHPSGIFCRSDHYNYARYGIPVAFFTTGDHADYHQVTDEPQYINYDRLADISRLVVAVVGDIANRADRFPVSRDLAEVTRECQ